MSDVRPIDQEKVTTRGVRTAAWIAFAWVAVFISFHVHWYLGGRLGRGDMAQPYPVPTSSAGYAYAAVIHAMFAAGVALPLSLFQRWGRRLPRPAKLAALVFATSILTLRGATSLVDTAVRLTGLAENGITGLTYQQIFGEPNPSDYTMWSSVAIDVNFLLGGLLFGWATLRYLRGRGRRPDQAWARTRGGQRTTPSEHATDAAGPRSGV